MRVIRALLRYLGRDTLDVVIDEIDLRTNLLAARVAKLELELSRLAAPVAVPEPENAGGYVSAPPAAPVSPVATENPTTGHQHCCCDDPACAAAYGVDDHFRCCYCGRPYVGDRSDYAHTCCGPTPERAEEIWRSGVQLWDEYWEGLTPEERVRELQSMAEHVDQQEDT